MAKELILKFKNARELFPNEITKVRAHDLISKSISMKNILSKAEQEKLQEQAMKIRDNEIFGINCDMFAIRKGRQIKLIPFN